MGRETRHECRILPKGVLNMKYCPYCGADLADGVREESADCGRWSEKAKRETRKVTKAYGKETQAPVSKATEKA